jgi:hypothetical protein
MAGNPAPIAPDTPTYMPGGVAPTVHKDSAGQNGETTSTNAWTNIIASAADHPDGHLAKVTSHKLQGDEEVN